MKRFILAHDLGTTGNKATLFDDEGRLIASTFGGYETAHPQPTWAEQDPNDWWRAVCNATQALLAKSKVASQDIASVSFGSDIVGERSPISSTSINQSIVIVISRPSSPNSPNQ